MALRGSRLSETQMGAHRRDGDQANEFDIRFGAPLRAFTQLS